MENAEAKIEHIMSRFNFVKVRKAMLAVGWIYHQDKHTPTMSDIKKTALYVLKKVSEMPEKDTGLTTGGFHAHKKGDAWLSLTFELTVYDSGYWNAQ